MIIKITKIISTSQPFQPVNKNYKVFSWVVSGLIDNALEETVTEIKSFKQCAIEPGIILDVEKQEYMGKISFKIMGIKKPQSETKSYTTTSRGHYTLEEYNNLFLFAWNMFEPRLVKISEPAQRIECLQKLISTYIISAVQNGIKIPQNLEYNAVHSSNRQNLLYNQGVA
ncbi:MAG: hypothetical protein A2355_02585 [Spirochaetes bacterium RIFOXYB1_FULL_32_8]|nr:MAG: hypothetical protein A2Y29_01520 [Spirochaetes bacterium GWE2_31_10]OHD74109.1 MAG: hypothetical protein A2355_02585 [Spirochaetes bacterium RIFOXYB1_FULL_32_8]HBD94632.1 hypothetical protein [Spirochaetia bacterium]HBI39252.1 hypothetical protein [Spirochaetia bacterium]